MSGNLPMTGATITVLGVSAGLSWFVGLAILAILSGVLILRVATRDQRNIPTG